MSEGVIYILQNEAMPGYIKIGMTTTSIEQRMRELDSSGVPLPFECYHAALVADVGKVEKLMHDTFADRRVRNRREFFTIDAERARSAVLLAQLEDVTPKSDVVENDDDQMALNKARTFRGRFNFDMVDIPVGSILTFTKGVNIICKVLDHKYVEFEGERLTLSGSALIVINRMDYSWKQIAGPNYWKFEDETLAERRIRMEDSD